MNLHFISEITWNDVFDTIHIYTRNSFTKTNKNKNSNSKFLRQKEIMGMRIPTHIKIFSANLNQSVLRLQTY